MAAEAGLSVDEEGFRSLMAEQRRRAKEDAQARKHAHADLSVYKEFVDEHPTEFTGFTELNSEATVLALLQGGVRIPTATAGQDVEVILDRSPLYAESGGQIADQGSLTGGGSAGAGERRAEDREKGLGAQGHDRRGAAHRG